MTPHTQEQLVWTQERPQDEGWFWVQYDNGRKYIVEIRWLNPFGGSLRLRMLVVVGGQLLKDIPETARWAGPITLPVEPKEGEG